LSGAGDEEEGAKARDKEDGRTHPRAVARSRRAAGRATHALVAAAMARCDCRGSVDLEERKAQNDHCGLSLPIALSNAQKNTMTPQNNQSYVYDAKVSYA
jgi:hypothetical protein